MLKKVEQCRVCQKKTFTKVFNFGPTPLANEFLSDPEKEELFFPLEVIVCNNCKFMQLAHVVSANTLFGKYLYFSSTSQVFINHFEKFATYYVNNFKLTEKSFVVDIGSNDGILLKPFIQKGIKVLGVEPARHIAKFANEEGIPTIPKYFNEEVAAQIVKKHGKADLITATNVFAHIDNLDEIIRGIKTLLTKNGVFVIEAPYLVDFFKKNYFDLVYHEHLSYWSVDSLSRIFKRFDMEIFDVKKVNVHGGSLRVFVQKNDGGRVVNKVVSDMIRKEKQFGLQDISTYKKFQMKVEKNKIDLLTLLLKLKKKGKTIAGYGAPAKGNTLLNYFGIGPETLEYIVDDSTYKQNLYTPGKRIKVVSKKALIKNPTDYLLILAWNFEQSIISANKEFRKSGGKFIVPVPKPKIL